MSDPKLIGITGYARHGKGSIAKVLEKRGYTVLSFAEPVRQFLYALNPCMRTKWGSIVSLRAAVDSYGWDAAKNVLPELRGYLQRCGTDAAKPIFGDRCWASIGINKAHAVIAAGGKVCFDDTRFPVEEGEAIYSARFDMEYPSAPMDVLGFCGIDVDAVQIWRVTRFNADGTIFDNGIGTDHPSESQVQYFEPDEEIENHGLAALEVRVNEILDSRKQGTDPHNLLAGVRKPMDPSP